MKTTKNFLVVVMGFAVVSALVGGSMPTAPMLDESATASDGCDLGALPNCKDAIAGAGAHDVTGTVGDWMRRLSGRSHADDHDPRIDSAWTDVQGTIAHDRSAKDMADREAERAKLLDIARRRLYGRR